MKWNSLKRSSIIPTRPRLRPPPSLPVQPSISPRLAAPNDGHPASGRFIDVGGTRLHYTDEGEGPPVVLLHGNGVTARDWRSSGVIGALAGAASRHRLRSAGFWIQHRPRAARLDGRCAGDVAAPGAAQTSTSILR